jgi:hypothetical protein
MKAKPVLLVVLTLLLGFILGWLTSAQVRLQKLKPVRFYFSEEHFREGFYKTIQPDEKQKAEIEKILDNYARLNSEMQANFRKEFEANIKAFRKELDSKLTKEQLARLKEIDEQRQEMIRHNRRNRDDSTVTLRTGSKDYRDSQRRPSRADMQQGPPPGPPPPPPPPLPQDTTNLSDDK